MSSSIQSAPRRDTTVPVAVKVGLLAGAAAVAWLPFIGVPLSRDEAGLLMVGSQWGPGLSLYGDYWVDRPPLLVALFGAISVVGDDAAVRVLGAVAAAISVVAAAALGRALAPLVPRAPVALAAVTAVATATPLMGAGAVNAEILAVPFVLAGLWAMVRALADQPASTTLGFAVLAGALGAGAALVKQNFIDVFVFATVVLVLLARLGGGHRRRALSLAGYVTLGALLVGGSVLGGAAILGTDPRELWDALVVFRAEASGVLAASATGDTAQRFAILVASLLATAMPLLVLFSLPAFLRPPRARVTGQRPAIDLRLPAVVVLAWELVGVLLGGSYWLHYLVGLVPGVALVVGLAIQRHPSYGRGFRVSMVLASISTIVTIAVLVVRPEPVPEQAAIDYLRAHAEPGDTGVVAFGAPNILRAAGLTSPYPSLWSLPVRVRDPQLDVFTAVLAGPDRPDWLVVAGASIATWGVDEHAALPYLEAHYSYRADAGDFRIYSLTDSS